MVVVPAEAGMLFAVSTTDPPTQVVGGVAVKLLMVGFGFTVTVIVAALEQPVGPLTPSSAVTV